MPGCRLPTSRHVDSAYCCRTHADQDDDGAIAAAAGYKRDGAPFEHTATDRLLGGASGGAPPEALRSLELLVCHAALPGGWAYPRAPPLIALRCGAEGVKLLPATLHELTKLVLRQATETAKAQADAPAAGLYDLLSWLRAELPSMLQRLSMLTPLERPPAVEEEEEAAAPPPVDLALARKNALYHKTQRTLEARREQEVSEEEEARRRWDTFKESMRREGDDGTTIDVAAPPTSSASCGIAHSCAPARGRPAAPPSPPLPPPLRAAVRAE